MNGLDVIILVVFFISVLIGALRGFTKEVLSLFSWGGAISLSYVFLPLGRQFVVPYIANPMMADGVAYFGLFIVFLVILSIIASVIASYIHESAFRGLDHSLGFGFGILRGIVIISAAELAFSTFSPRQTQSHNFQTARFIPMARKGGDTLLQILPHSLRATIIEQAIKVENQINSKGSHQLVQGAKNMVSSMGGEAPGIGGNFDSSSTMNASGASRDYGVQGNYSQGYAGQSGQTQSFSFPQSGGGQQYPSAQGVVQEPIRQQQDAQGSSAMMGYPQTGQGSQISQYPQPMMHSPQGNPHTMGPQQSEYMSQPPTQGLVQSAIPQDKQSTVDQLSRLTPQAMPKEDSGYTQSQRDDMNRLFQAADGDQ